MLLLIGIMTAVALPRFINLNDTAKTKAAEAGIAELNGREKLLWTRAVMINDSATLATDTALDQSIFASMDFDLNSGSATDWSVSDITWGDTSSSATLSFKNTDISITRSAATLQTPGKWSSADSSSTSTVTTDFSYSQAWAGANTWTVTDDVVSSDGNNGFLLDDTVYENVTITVDATLSSGNGYGIVYNATKTGNSFPDGYAFQFDPGLGNKFVIRLYQDGKESVIGSVSMSDIFGSSFDLSAEHQISITVVDNNHTISVDGQVVLSLYNDTYSSGSVGYRTWSGSDATFSNLTVETQ
jgi:hypothetical protein